jgi:hypothetical protein
MLLLVQLPFPACPIDGTGGSGSSGQRIFAGKRIKSGSGRV